MSSRRNLIAVLALLALLALAFPLLVSIFGELVTANSPSAPTKTKVALQLIPTSTATTTPTSTLTPSLTPTSTSTATATSTATFTPTSTPTSTPTATSTPTPTPRPRVYLAPFVQVFAVGQPQPTNSSQVLMYSGGADVFEVSATQGTFVRLQTLDGNLSFWTASGNISAVQPPAAQYDYSVRGRTARLSTASVFACVYDDRPTLAFGPCQQLNNISTAILNARVTAGGSPFYIALINGVLYVIPANAIL